MIGFDRHNDFTLRTKWAFIYGGHGYARREGRAVGGSISGSDCHSFFNGLGHIEDININETQGRAVLLWYWSIGLGHLSRLFLTVTIITLKLYSNST